MPEFSLAGKPYRIVDESRVNQSTRVYAETMRPSQPSEARLNTKTWQLSGPIGNSRQLNPSDPLGPDYTVNLDGRNAGLLTSAAKRNAVSLTAITEFAYGVPISDVSKTNWTQGAGDGDGNAFDELDEGIISGTPDDATRYWTNAGNTGSANRLDVNITSLTDPGVNINHRMRVRYRHSGTSDTLALTLSQGGVPIASSTLSSHTGDWSTWGVAISEAAAANITDYTDLELEIQIDSGSGTLDVTAFELQIPAADAGNVVTIDEDRGQLFVQRGTFSTQVNPGSMTEAQHVDHGAQVTGSVASWRGNGIVALGSTDAEERTAVVAGTSATYAAITNLDADHIAIGPDRLWISDASDGQAKYVTADLAVTAANLSNGIAVADTNSGTITGLYTLGDLMIAGTQRGARSFTDQGAPAVLGEGVKDFPSSFNGANGDSLWGWHYHATILGLYAIQPEIPIENPVGPGEGADGQRFEGPIDGYPIAVKAWKDSLWVSYLSTDGDSWLLRGVFNPAVTPGSGRPDWFVFRKLSSTKCTAIGATTGRAVPAVVWGEGQDIAYADLAFRGREIADTTNYPFSTDGGEWFGTTLMLPVGLVGNVRWAKFLSENCDASNTWTLAFSRDEGSYSDLGSAVQTAALQTIRDGATDDNSFTTLKPRLTQVAASETSPPQIRGMLTVAYDERPEHVREISVLVEGHGEDLSDFQTLVDAGQELPVAFRSPYDTTVNADRYCYVLNAEAEDLANGEDQGIRLTLIEWAES